MGIVRRGVWKLIAPLARFIAQFNWNWVFRWLIVGPIVLLLVRVQIEGLEKLPQKEPFIFAMGPHRTEIESVIFAAALRRYAVRFFAKAEYWEKSWVHRAFMELSGQIPLHRSGSRLVLEQIDTGVRLTKEEGAILGMYPEGTRNKLLEPSTYGAREGVAYIALKAQVPVYPVGYIGMQNVVSKKGGLGIRPGRVTIMIGDPIMPDVLPYFSEHPRAAKMALKVAAPLLAEQIGREIARLSVTTYRKEFLPIAT